MQEKPKANRDDGFLIPASRFLLRASCFLLLASCHSVSLDSRFMLPASCFLLHASCSGNGSKKEGGNLNVPPASPMGRGALRSGGIGRIYAIGTLRLHSNIVSPPARRSRYCDRWVLAS